MRSATIAGFAVAAAAALPRPFVALPNYTCPQQSAHNASSVHELQPSDVSVVLALGDSVTAGFGIAGFHGGALDEERGLSWSIGGDDGALTLPNLLRHFSPSLRGFSTGKHLDQVCYGRFCPGHHEPTTDHLNAALSGAMALNLPEQVDYLVDQMNVMGVDVAGAFKLVTLFIGANDLCVSCFAHDPDKLVAEWTQHINSTLLSVRERIPRSYVNVVQIFPMSTLYNLSMGKRSTTYCEAFHTLLFAECDCLYGPTVTHKERAAVDTIAARLNTATAAVVAALNTVRDEAFAVTLHPMLTRTTSDMLPMSFLTDVDCFHPSLLGHRAVATGLWNAMLTPPAQRSDVLDLDAQPTCPPDGAVFRTDFN